MNGAHSLAPAGGNRDEAIEAESITNSSFFGLPSGLCSGQALAASPRVIRHAVQRGAHAPSAKPTIGAIRWDGWQPGQVPLATPHIGFLRPSQWRYRLPFYGVEVDRNTVTLAANTQAVMDQEIAYAHSAGLDFFCFNHYLSELRQSLNLYLSSARKGDIRFCLQMGALSPERVADAVNLIRTEPTYQKVAGGRPLVFIQDLVLCPIYATRTEGDRR